MTDGNDDPKQEAAYTERDGNLEHHYDSSGNLIGHTERDGDREHHYDPSWNITGRTERDGELEHHYDPSWNTTGRTERDGELAHHYDPSWNSTGHTERDGNLERHYDRSWNRVGASPGSGSSSTSSSSDGTDEAAAVAAGLIVLGLLIWMSSCVVKSIRALDPETPTSAISSPTQERPLQLGVMATASAVHGWRDYTPKSEFLQGEELFLYAEALNVNHDGRIDLVFDDRIVATNGKVIVNATVPVAKSASTVSSWATWQGLWIPSDTPPGSYVASVSIRDNTTGQVGTQSTSFRVGVSTELQMGMLATCLEVRGWKDYTAQTSFMPGDQVFLYAEVLNVNHEGRIDLSFDDSIFTPTGTKLLGTAVPVVSTTATGPSWAAWPSFTIPSDAPPGPYTATVAVRDNVTGSTGSKSVMFTVSALNQTSTEEADGTATDPVGDALPWSGVAVSPDLIFARGTIDSGHLTLNVRFAPGTFSSSTTLVTVSLDTDQNPLTGQPGINGQGTTDADQIGSEFIVVMGSSTNGDQAQISRYVGPPPNRFTQIGHAPVTFFDDGMEITFPLSTLGVDSGGINFKVVCSSRISASGFTSILDVLPNVGLPPVRVAQSR